VLFFSAQIYYHNATKNASTIFVNLKYFFRIKQTNF